MSGDPIESGEEGELSGPEQGFPVVRIGAPKKHKPRMASSEAAAEEPVAEQGKVGGAEPEEDADSDHAVQAGIAEPETGLSSMLTFCACAETQSSNLDVDLQNIDKNEPFYFPEEYKYSGHVFCYDKDVWRPGSEKRDVFSSMGPENPTREPGAPPIHADSD